MRDVRSNGAASLVSAVIVREGKVALVAAGPDRWQSLSGHTLIPLELPGGMTGPQELPQAAIARLCEGTLGASARALSSPHIFGPSPTHRIDRLAKDAESPPYPLLRFERAIFVNSEHGDHVSTLVGRAFLAELIAQPTFSESVAGFLWSTPDGLLTLMRGLSFEDVSLSPHAIEWLPNPAYALPADAFFYVPAEYGERHLARAVAKYGRSLLEAKETHHGT